MLRLICCVCSILTCRLGVPVTRRDKALADRILFLQNAAGVVPSPFDCFLVNRGLKTLHVRMRTHQANALACARFLEWSPKVTDVIYPGLESHPQHALAVKQCTGFSGMISFRIRGTLATARTFLDNLRVFMLAESLGAVESLIEIPALMTHASVPAPQRVTLGITDTLIRLSVGLEDVGDLIADLENALAAAVRCSLVASLALYCAHICSTGPGGGGVLRRRAGGIHRTQAGICPCRSCGAGAGGCPCAACCACGGGGAGDTCLSRTSSQSDVCADGSRGRGLCLSHGRRGCWLWIAHVRDDGPPSRVCKPLRDRGSAGGAAAIADVQVGNDYWGNTCAV